MLYLPTGTPYRGQRVDVAGVDVGVLEINLTQGIVWHPAGSYRISKLMNAMSVTGSGTDRVGAKIDGSKLMPNVAAHKWSNEVER